ncbi:MAG: LacI family DNA-binding transcriptional regulator [Actinomycetota bacterium]|nr:LacI family DNA-binding transcriptional regulator [Actinomycetota bacterium]
MKGSKSEEHQRRRRVTSIDVARLADVSQATVSRAFTTPEIVAPDKRERIFETAAELGYVPNAIGRSLSSQSSRLIAVVVPAGSEYYQHALGALARHVVPSGYQLLLFESFESADLDVVVISIPQYHVDGVIVASSIVPVTQVQPLIGSGLPVLMFNQHVTSGDVASVSIDNEAGMRRLASLLAENGHRSVCFVGGIRDATTDRARYRGASEQLADARIPCRYVLAGDFTYEAGYAAAEEIAAFAVRPDAAMAASDAIAIGLIDGLRARGISVPGDISVTGFDGLPQSAWKAYDLTTIVQPMQELARLAVETLVDQIENDKPTTPPQQLLEGHLQIRGTVAKRESTE